MIAKTINQDGVSREPELRKLFLDELEDIYWAEQALVKFLPRLAMHVSGSELVLAIEDHLTDTKIHVDRLEQVFDIIKEKASAKKCEAMDGLITEAGEIMKESEEGVLRDAGIISAAQKIAHYEIASYGTLIAFANTLGELVAASLLEQTLEEEKEADRALTEIAESSINLDAAGKE